MTPDFKLLHADTGCAARCGIINTDHGQIPTPAFMPVGTAGTVKAIHQSELRHQIKAPVILGNTYHLYLRPGLEVIKEAKGLHNFISWNHPVLTDSGGYQVFSLSERRKIDKNGVHFQSHIDGSKHYFTPASVVDIQRVLGSDIMMALDECPPYPCDKSYARKSMNLTHEWLEKGFSSFEDNRALYGHDQIFVPIAQGSVYDDLRLESLKFISRIEHPIYAIGGLSVGEPEEDLLRLVRLSGEQLPETSARYLMGVGTPKNILDCIELGIDMFDCVLPSRNARHGIIYTSKGIIHIKNAQWKTDFSSIDNGIDLPTSENHSKAYLRHLFMSKEILAAQLATLQNLRFYTWLTQQAQIQILENNFTSWKKEILPVISKPASSES